ncbi:hemin uptake protein HemP [Paucibacter soli]|uniref:hemin uptake protein HemP n=1 Tax=Paucibacter soli TaxID=3133433 RepID=UPI0030AD28D9
MIKVKQPPPSRLAPEEDIGLPTEAAATLPLRRLCSTQLLGAARELEIAHRDQVYRLRLTSLGKLILTK